MENLRSVQLEVINEVKTSAKAENKKVWTKPNVTEISKFSILAGPSIGKDEAGFPSYLPS
jgi:hypothetical protein